MHPKKTCLIVEDSDVVRKVMRLTIEGLGFVVEEASEVADAVTRCRAKLPDLLVLDWHLPAAQPLEVLAAVRSMPSGRNVKILYVLTNNDPTEIGRGIAAGANDHLIKPFRCVTLEAKIVELTTPQRSTAGPSNFEVPRVLLRRSSLA